MGRARVRGSVKVRSEGTARARDRARPTARGYACGGIKMILRKDQHGSGHGERGRGEGTAKATARERARATARGYSCGGVKMILRKDQHGTGQGEGPGASARPGRGARGPKEHQ
eukprot:10601491-Karenia_brevis.AAC.1